MADAEKFIETARGYLTAVQILCEHTNPNTLAPIGLLASQAVELALKAYLLHQGKSETELKRIGHDLSKAWDEAASAGLGITWEARFSVDVLSLSHDSPFLFRYPKTGEAVAITEPQKLCSDLEMLISEVERSLP